MFNEELGVIDYEVESDDSIQLIENPQDIVIPTTTIQEQKQTTEQIVQQPLQQEVDQTNINHNNENIERQQLEEEQMLRRPYALRWKKKSIKKLEKITQKMTDQDLEDIKDVQIKKIAISESKINNNNNHINNNNNNDVIISGSILKNPHNTLNQVQKQKQFQVLVEHFANKPDFLEAIIAQDLEQDNENQDGGILKKPMIVPPKAGLKKQPGRKKANVTFEDQSQPPNGGIQFIKTSVLPQKQPPPPPQPQQQISNILSKFQEYREKSVAPTQSQQTTAIQESSDVPLGTGAWYPNKQDKKSQPFIPPHAGSNPKMLPTVSSVQMISPSQAAQQSLNHKFLGMNQNQSRFSNSPPRVRDMITQQYTSSYQVDRPPIMPSRQQPVFQQQILEKNINYELNQVKKNKEQLSSHQQSQLRESQVKLQAKLQESVKRQSVAQPTIEENDSDFMDDVMESQAFIDFKRAGNLICGSQQQQYTQQQYWQEINFNTDIPKDYYMNEKFRVDVGEDIEINDPYELFKLYFDQSIFKYICQISNKRQCIRIDEDILESFISALIYIFYIQLLGMREIKRVRFDHILDYVTFGHICKEIRIDELEDYSFIFEKISKNFKNHYQPEEFLTLDTPIFYQNHSIEGLISLSDGMKGYVLDLIYGIKDQKIIQSLQKYQGKHHKLYLGPEVSSLNLITQLKKKQFGSLAKIVDKQTQLTQDQIQEVKQNAQKGKSTQFLSSDNQTIMLIYAERQQHLQYVEGFVSSFADFTRLKPQDTKIKGDVNKPIILYLYDKIKTQYDKRGKTYQYSQIPHQDSNQHLEILVQLVYSSIYNANILNKTKNQSQSMAPDKAKQMYLDFVKQLLHSFYVRSFKRRGINQFPQNHTLESGDTGTFSCIECGESSQTICRECSNHFQMLIPVCRNKNEQCLKSHIEMLVNQPKITNSNRRLTNKQAIVKFEFYRSQIQSSKDSNAKSALPVIEDTLQQLDSLDPDEELSIGIQTLLVSLSDLIQKMFQQPNILVPQKIQQKGQEIYSLSQIDPPIKSAQQLSKSISQVYNHQQEVMQCSQVVPQIIKTKISEQTNLEPSIQKLQARVARINK
ncbi:unnamed protein product [Paramecium sonneborni]|uniref:PiggyBac transposable element-derived protein domain-containing protein n=1 Tax=Paramecium sonneborni TaxID=65129 RepID=A0A8S1NC74_9CILI|nr:unnamed protein product [Paramecium sonneborni]